MLKDNEIVSINKLFQLQFALRRHRTLQEKRSRRELNKLLQTKKGVEMPYMNYKPV